MNYEIIHVSENKKHKDTLPERLNRASQQFNEVLEKVSSKELKEFIKEYGKTNKQFRTHFLSSFARLHKKESKSFYQKKIKSAVNFAKGKRGFISWRESKYLIDGITPIVNVAKKKFENGDFLISFYISVALMEELVAALQFSDDSSGRIGEIIENSYEMLYAITAKDISAEIRNEIYNYCLFVFEKKFFKGWEWHIDILRIAYELVTDENEADTIIEYLNTINEEYNKETAQAFIFDIVKEYKGEKECQKYLEKYITNSAIRDKVIVNAIENKEFEKAVKFAKEGIEFDREDKPGLIYDWYNRLLEIAQLQEDSDKILEYAKLLFIGSFSHKKDYYEIFKQNVDKSDWSEFLEELILEIKEKGGWGSYELISKIFINEKWWDRLLVLLKNNLSLVEIAAYEKYLSKDYAHELVQFYAECLPEYLEKNVDRKSYRTACDYLQKMKILGGNKEVSKLIRYFRETYPRRYALLEELKLV